MLSLMWCNFSGLDCLSGKTAFKAESRLECERAQTELEIQLFCLFILNLTRSISPINPPAISMHWPKMGKPGHLAGGYFEQTHETKTVWQTPNVWAAITATAPRQPSASQHNANKEQLSRSWTKQNEDEDRRVRRVRRTPWSNQALDGGDDDVMDGAVLSFTFCMG